MLLGEWSVRLRRGTFLTDTAPRLRQWLQPLCFFHLHECNSGWLSSSAQCTSSGKVSSLSHRQSRQSAWHRGGRAVHRRFKAELSLADDSTSGAETKVSNRWQPGEQTKKEKKRATETYLHGVGRQQMATTSGKTSQGERRWWWACECVSVCSRFEWAHRTSQSMSTSLPLFLIRRCREAERSWVVTTEFQSCCFLTASRHRSISRALWRSGFSLSQTRAYFIFIIWLQHTCTLSQRCGAASGLSAVCSVGSWRAGCCSPTESGLTVFTVV